MRVRVTDLTHDKDVDDEYDEWNDEEDEHLSDPRPDWEQWRWLTTGSRLPRATFLSGGVIGPEVELHRTDQQTTDYHTQRHFERTTRRTVTHLLKFIIKTTKILQSPKFTDLQTDWTYLVNLSVRSQSDVVLFIGLTT